MESRLDPSLQKGFGSRQGALTGYITCAGVIIQSYQEMHSMAIMLCDYSKLKAFQTIHCDGSRSQAVTQCKVFYCTETEQIIYYNILIPMLH